MSAWLPEMKGNQYLLVALVACTDPRLDAVTQRLFGRGLRLGICGPHLDLLPYRVVGDHLGVVIARSDGVRERDDAVDATPHLLADIGPERHG